MRRTISAAALAAVALLAGACGGQIGGTGVAGPTPAPTTTSSGSGGGGSGGPVVTEEAITWMNDWCATANLMIQSMSVSLPPIEGDPAEYRPVLIETVTRTESVLGVVLGDLARLRDNPVDGGDVVINVFYADLVDVHTRFGAARSLLESSPELTVELLGDATEQMQAATTKLEGIPEKLAVIKLPDTLVEAAAQAPNCADGAEPTG